MQITNFSRRTFLLISAAFAVQIAALLAAGYWWLLADLPPIDTIEERIVRPRTEILDRNGRLLYEVIDQRTGKQINIGVDALPHSCINATLATEDSRFFFHPGVDPIAVVRAILQNLQSREVVSGSSTLTMQLARNLLLEPNERYDQSLRRKLREVWVALRLEHDYTKEELLTLYLNQTYYGNFAFGIEAASQIFFAKPASQLSTAECALLAGLIQYPTGYNPLQYPDTAKARQLTVLRLMREAGYLTAAESASVAAQKLRYRTRLFQIEAPHFVVYIEELLAKELGTERLRRGGLRITTTLDLDLQKQAEAIIRHRLALLNCRKPGLCDQRTDPNRRVENAAAIVLDSQSGEILAMVGSPDYFDERIQGNVNAALSLRQPGSAIKPFTYAAALDPNLSSARHQTPLTAATIIPDLPTTFYVTDRDSNGKIRHNVPYTPVNYDRRHHGPVSIRTALANSYNIPAVKVLDQIGVEALQQIATAAGISTLGGDLGLAATLGGSEVTLLELTSAFGVFQNGTGLDSHAILKIEQLSNQEISASTQIDSKKADEEGTQHYRPVDRLQIIAPETAYLITDILSDKIARIPAFGERSVLDLPFSAAVKTGTTTEWRDNWTIGYSTQRIVGVWVGNADNSPMLDVSGVDGAGPIWHDLMLAAHVSDPPSFQRPINIEEITICTPSGLLPGQHCSRLRQERFIRGTAPTRKDDQFQQIAIDRATGLRATDRTPPSRIGQRTYWVLPPIYHDWMIAQGLAIAPPPTIDRQIDPLAAPPRVAVNSQRQQESSSNALLLTEPTSNMVYQVAPGVPRERQRIKVSGVAPVNRRELRLMVDGQPLATAYDSARLAAWWELTPGTHNFWLETIEDGIIFRSQKAHITVEEFALDRGLVGREIDH